MPGAGGDKPRPYGVFRLAWVESVSAGGTNGRPQGSPLRRSQGWTQCAVHMVGRFASVACAAAKRATGTRSGEQLT